MRKLTTMIATALAIITASVASADTLVMTPVTPGMGEHHPSLITGTQYPVVVFLKDNTKRYYAGTFIGYMKVLDSKRAWSGDWKPVGKNVVATVDKATAQAAAGVYLAFKGANSMLLCRSNPYEGKGEWLIIEGSVQW